MEHSSDNFRISPHRRLEPLNYTPIQDDTNVRVLLKGEEKKYKILLKRVRKYEE